MATSQVAGTGCFTHSFLGVKDLQGLISPITLSYCEKVTSYLPIQKPRVRVTCVCGPSSDRRPRSSSGLPIMNEPGAIHTSSITSTDWLVTVVGWRTSANGPASPEFVSWVAKAVWLVELVAGRAETDLLVPGRASAFSALVRANSRVSG